MKCGSAIIVKNSYGVDVTRYVAQCGGTFLLITREVTEYRNGLLLGDWRGVLRELVSQAQPVALIEHLRTASGMGDDGEFHTVPLTWPLSISELAGLLSVQPYEVRDQLADLAVSAE